MNEHPEQNNLLPERLPNGKFPKVKMWAPPPPGERNGPFPRIKEREPDLADDRLLSSPLDIPEWLINWRNKCQEGKCRMCQRPEDVRPLTKHHLIPQRWWKAQAGYWPDYRNIAANIIPLCWPCHKSVERTLDGRRMLRKVLGQDEVALADAVRGRPWLDRRYPR